MISRKALSSAAAAAALALVSTALSTSTARADLVVNTNLGNLGPGVTNLVGTTVGGVNNADNYAPISNPAAVWDQEFVYQFTTAQQMIASLTSNDPNGAIDNDFFMLNSLATGINGSGLREAQTIQSGLVEVNGSFGILAPGTYYLSIDAWRGVPGAAGTPPTGRAGPYNANLTLAQIVAPSATAAVLGGSLTGNLGAGQIQWYSFSYGGGTGFSIDTEGSTLAPSNDTELGLYDSNGTLIVDDDDAGSGFLSLISSGPLPSGTYYLALGGFNTEFGDGFQVSSTSTNSGPYVINGISIPEPGSLALLKRRRHARDAPPARMIVAGRVLLN